MAPIAEQEDRQHDVIEHAVVLGRDQAEQQRLAGDALQAVLAAGERRLHAEEVDHLGEGERDHGEVDALAADRQRSRHQAQRRRAQHAGQQAELGRQVEGLHDIAVEVARHAEEHGVAEAHQAGIAQQQVEGAGEQREAQRRHQEHRIGDPRRQQRQRPRPATATTSAGRPASFGLPEQAGRPDQQHQRHDDEDHRVEAGG